MATGTILTIVVLLIRHTDTRFGNNQLLYLSLLDNNNRDEVERLIIVTNKKGGIIMLSLINVNEAGQPIELENVNRLIQDQNFESYLAGLHAKKMRRAYHARLTAIAKKQ